MMARLAQGQALATINRYRPGSTGKSPAAAGFPARDVIRVLM